MVAILRNDEYNMRRRHHTFQFSVFSFQLKSLRLLGLLAGDNGLYGYYVEPGYKPQYTQFTPYPRVTMGERYHQ